MRWVFLLIPLTCLVSGCDLKARERAHANYHAWVKRLETEATLDLSKLAGVWERSKIIRVAHDPVDDQYDEAFEELQPESGVLLMFEGDELSQEYVRGEACPPLFPHAQYLVDHANLDSKEGSRAPEKDMRLYMETLHDEPKYRHHWKKFSVTGDTLHVSRTLSMQGDPRFTKRIVGLTDKTLEIAFYTGKQSQGVHEVIEEYKKLDGATLNALLKKSKDAKECKMDPVLPGLDRQKWETGEKRETRRLSE